MTDSMVYKLASSLRSSPIGPAFSKTGSGNSTHPEKLVLRQALIERARIMRIEMRKALDLQRKYSVDDGDSRLIDIKDISRAELVLNRYKVEGMLGSGAIANVYKVWDSKDQKLKAMKTLIPKLHKEGVVRRFVREAGVLAALDHSNIITAQDLSWNSGRPIIVLEHIEGAKDFDSIIKEFNSNSDNQKQMYKMLYYLIDICEALKYLHGRSSPIIHRDLKPANILVSQDEVKDNGPARSLIKISDFGLSKIPEYPGGDTITILTHMEGIIGTPLYAAIPDMLRGSPIDERSDLYSLGIILYKVITGKLPFVGISTTPVGETKRNHLGKTHYEKNHLGSTEDYIPLHEGGIKLDECSPSISNSNSNLSVIFQHRDEAPDFSCILPGIPTGLVALTKSLLEKDPNRRPQSADEVKEELTRIAQNCFF